MSAEEVDQILTEIYERQCQMEILHKIALKKAAKLGLSGEKAIWSYTI